jgi:superfamily II DNA/RNA helicase
MDKQNYLENTQRRLEELHLDSNFQRSIYQARARAIQEEFVPEQSTTQFSFEPKRVWRYCDYVFSESILLLKENFGDRIVLLERIKTTAQTFEFLAKFADECDKEILLINAAICYEIAGYQANASCLSRLIEVSFLAISDNNTPESNTPDIILFNTFRRTIVKFLRREIKILPIISNEALSRIDSFQETITTGIASGELSFNEIFNLTSHAYFHKSISDFVQYCLNGNEDFLSSCRLNMGKSHRNFEKAGDAILSTITLEFQTILDLFNERSTWSNIAEYASHLLQDPVWQFYLRTLANEKGIVEFWPSQLKAIRHNLLTSNDSFIVQMPTSAGKTFIAELAIIAALTARPNSRCLYIAPYRALVNEVKNSLSDTLGSIGYQVSTLLGGFEFDIFQEYLITQSDVLIATPEKVDLLLRTQPEYFEELAVIIIDEGHIIDEGIPSLDELSEEKTLLDELEEQGNLGRGVLLEFLITRIKQTIPNVKFIFLSAVMPLINANDFVNWLCESQQEPLRIRPEERPSRQVLAKFEWRSKSNGEIEYISLPILPNGKHPWVPSFIKRKQYYTGELTPQGKRQRKSWPDINNKSQSTATLAARLAKTGPVLVFCAQTNDARNVLTNLVETLKYLEASNELPNNKFRYVETPELDSFYEALEWLGEEHPLTKALHYGVALHYGPLPDPVRQAIENEFRNGSIQILVSTNTLGQGVNLPVKTVVIHSLEYRYKEINEEGNETIHTKKLKKRDFWNICGRAGRAGKETEGQIIFVKISENDRILIQEYYSQVNLEEVNSPLYKLLLALIERRINQDELIGYLDSYILAMLAEEVVDTQDESSIANFLEGSLVGIQALRKETDNSVLVSTIKGVASWVVNQVPSNDLQKVFSSTGLRVSSCQALEESVNVFLENIEEESIFLLAEPLRCSETFVQVAFSACRSLPEMKLPKNIEYDGTQNELILIQNWINGIPIGELRRSYWNAEKAESFSRYLADRVTYKLPWGINGFLSILAFKRQITYRDLPLSWQHLPAMMKFGVNNIFACWASSLGVNSRSLALQIAERYFHEYGDQEPNYGNFTKWFVNLPNDYIFNELNISLIERNKLINFRNKVVINDESLQFIRNLGQELESPVRGIPYENRFIAASQVSIGDSLTLEAEFDNPYDRNAVSVLFRGNPIGYVQRDKAKIVSRELQLGRRVEAYATSVRSANSDTPFPWIDMSIRFE